MTPIVSTPSPPDPMETAAAQQQMNASTAITQQQLNMVNQVTPYGNLTYSQTGQNFTPSETGTTYYYNPATGEYRTDQPMLSAAQGGVTTTQTVPEGAVAVGGGDGGTRYRTSDGIETINAGAAGSSVDPAWQKVTGMLVPSYTATTTLSPEQQAILDQQNGANLNLATLANDYTGMLGGYLSDLPDFSSIPDVQTSVGGAYNQYLPDTYTTSLGDGYQTSYGTDWSSDRQKVEDALMARMNPSLTQAQTDLESQLVAKGIRPGTAAWDSEMARMGQQQNDARMSAVLAGGQEQTRLAQLAHDSAAFTNEAMLNQANFGNNATLSQSQFQNTAALQEAQFNNQAQNQAWNQYYQEYTLPINVGTALQSGSQVQNPNFVNTPSTSVAGVDYTGLVNQQYQAEAASSNAAMGGLFGLLSSGISMLSDRRAKMNARRIGALDNGLPVYSFQYIGSPVTQIGLMADEVENIHPEAVTMGADGLKRVRYDLAVGAA